MIVTVTQLFKMTFCFEQDESLYRYVRKNLLLSLFELSEESSCALDIVSEFL